VTPRRPLQCAALLTALHAALHLLRFAQIYLGNDDARPLLQYMDSVHVDIWGTSRSYLEFSFGNGLLASAMLALLAVLIWQLGHLLERVPAVGRPMVRAIIAGQVVFSVIASLYFFVIATALSVLSALCLLGGLVRAKAAHGT
jgi:hypothetical protein